MIEFGASHRRRHCFNVSQEMKPTIPLAIGIALSGGLSSCKEKSPQLPAPVDTNLSPQAAALAKLVEMGGRLPRERDVPFVFAPFDDQIDVLLAHMKKADISLALPESVDLGNGLWKIAPEDLDRGRAVVEEYHLKESLKGFHFE